MTTPTTQQTASRSATDPRSMPMLTRGAELVPASFNDDDNTVDVVWTTGARGRRYDYWTDTQYEEELVVTPEAVDMTRFNAGVIQVFDSHRTYGGVGAILGVAIRGSIENGEGRATIRLSTRADIADIVTDIKAGIIRSISVGYVVNKYEITRSIDRADGGTLPLYRAISWTPHEISFVGVPFDAEASTRSAPAAGHPCEFITRAPAQSPTQQEPSMTIATQPGASTIAPADLTRSTAPAAPAPAPAAPSTAPAAADDVATRAATEAATRAADITDICTRHSVGHLAAGLIRGGNSVDQARAAVLEELARTDASATGHRNVRIETVTDEHQTRMAGIEEAVMHRVHARAPLTDNGRQYRGLSMIELGRELLEARGVNTRGMDRLKLAATMLQYRSGMHSTSDFAALFANVANKRMRGSYEQAAGTYTRWARQAPNAPDFKNINIVQLSAAPELMRTNEHGEFSYGTMSDAGMSYAVVTYGRVVALTRQAIVNDDLRAFDRLSTAFGASASRLENRLVYSQLTGNPQMGDNKALFHAAHGNLGAGALDLDPLKDGRKAMRKQVGLQKEKLNLAPAFLIVPTALEQKAYQLTSANYVPAKPEDVNEFRSGGRTAVEPIVEALLDDVSEIEWYLGSDNAQIDTVEFCYLDGAEGPQLDSEASIDVDGVSYRCRLDFGAAAVDHRGLFKSTGQ